MPWQTIGTADSWHKADELSLFYPGRGKEAGPVPSIRLKAYRRGQQDVEYLTLLAQVKGEPRWAIGRSVRQALRLETPLRPQDFWGLRVRVGKVLSEAGPAPKRRLVELRTPLRDLGGLVPGYVQP